MKLIPISILFFLVITNDSFGQLELKKEIEVEESFDYSNDRLVSFDEQGFLLFALKSKHNKGKGQYKIDYYNADLELESTKTLLMNPQYKIHKTAQKNNSYYTLFKKERGFYKLHCIEIETMKDTTISMKLMPIDFVMDMVVLNNYVFLVIERRGELFLYTIDLETGNVKNKEIEVEQYENTKVDLKGIEVIDFNNEILISVTLKEEKLKSNIYVFRYNQEGNKKDIFFVKPDVKTVFKNVSIFPLGEDHYYLNGTSSFENDSNMENGVFFCDYFIGENNDCFSYKMDLLIKKEERHKGTVGVSGNSMIELEDGYLFLEEVFFSRVEARTEDPSHYGSGFLKVSNIVNKYVYYYTDVIAFKIGFDGELAWHHSFTSSQGETFRFNSHFIHTEIVKDIIILKFISENKIKNIAIGFDGEIIAEIESEKLELYEELKQELRWYSSPRIYSIYNNYYTIIGIQSLINEETQNEENKYLKAAKYYFK